MVYEDEYNSPTYYVAVRSAKRATINGVQRTYDHRCPPPWDCISAKSNSCAAGAARYYKVCECDDDDEAQSPTFCLSHIHTWLRNVLCSSWPACLPGLLEASDGRRVRGSDSASPTHALHAPSSFPLIPSPSGKVAQSLATLRCCAVPLSVVKKAVAPWQTNVRHRTCVLKSSSVLTPFNRRPPASRDHPRSRPHTPHLSVLSYNYQVMILTSAGLLCRVTPDRNDSVLRNKYNIGFSKNSSFSGGYIK